MSEASKKFWQDQISRKGEINVPDLLDDWAKVVTQDLRDESDRYFTELQASESRSAKLVEALKYAQMEIGHMMRGEPYSGTAPFIIDSALAAHKEGGAQG